MIRITKKIILVMLAFFAITLFINFTFGIDNIEFYNPIGEGESSEVFVERVGKILGVIRVIGIIVAVGMLMIIGIKYIFGGIENKAEYKKSIIPYLIGFCLLVGVVAFLEIIESVMG